MQRRRQLIGMQGTKEQWDYVILPRNGASWGSFDITAISVLSGQTIIVQYTGVTNREQVTLIDGYFARTSPQYITYCKDLTADDGTIELVAGRNGSVYFGDTRNSTVGNGSKMGCTSIKIRITNP